jgi:hypothetical protein
MCGHHTAYKCAPILSKVLALFWLVSGLPRLSWTLGVWLFELFVTIWVCHGLRPGVLEAAALFLLVLLCCLSCARGCEQRLEV